MFFRNAWYVAALDAELEDTAPSGQAARRAIGPLPAGERRPAALEDACVHRKLPLSMGRIKGDHVECGYHGMTYDADGKCVRHALRRSDPEGSAESAATRSFRATAYSGSGWATGRRPTLRTIFPVEHWGEPSWGVTRGDAMTVHCNYLYMTDNLLDPSHVAWVHPDSFGNAACESTPVEVKANESGCDRLALDARASMWRRCTCPSSSFQGPCDRLQHYEVRFPSHALIKAVFVPGRRGPCRMRNATNAPSSWIRTIS